MTTLLEVIRVRAGDRLVDLECGIGTVSEYIGDCTGAHVTGIDCAAAAIERSAAVPSWRSKQPEPSARVV
jgi:cyclopropane fatty-acyl-phospholipid synthase-like methyltransferase